ncbi:MAG: RNB domain-containing ribonuclease [Deltaproteobacteria bacterium]|nr:RNB domain-containing ribonuclease [Deltaproteobacteria bacterium]
MTSTNLQIGALLLYKSHPAKLIGLGDKIEIDLLFQAQSKKVRPKDVTCLHPGPFTQLTQLNYDIKDLEEARALLSGAETSLAEIAELVFNQTSAAAIWSAWQIVTTGIHFYGSPSAVKARSDEEYLEEIEKRAAKKARHESWQSFIERVAEKTFIDSDRVFLAEVENLALGQATESRLLQHLGRQQSRENAHALLLELKFWETTFNPHPQRLELLPDNPREDRHEVSECLCSAAERLDLTRLDAFAIDDEDSNDPDDAISFDGKRVWVHIADVASLIDIDTPADHHARDRAATLYLPETTRPMLPQSITDRLGIGLQETSLALSFALDLDARGTILDFEIVPSRIRVTRLSYNEAENLLDTNPQLTKLLALTRAHREQRLRAGAVEIELPECKIKVCEKRISITPLPNLQSRNLVSEAMLMTGAACAIYAQKHDLAMPHASQTPPQELPETDDLPPLVGMYAKRRAMRPGRLSCSPLTHFGLGLKAYIRVTSPLRRYLDLIAHQQLRRHLKGLPTLDQSQITARIAAVSSTSAQIRQAERLSNRHWTLTFLQQHPEWQGIGIVMAEWGRKSLLLVPELALEVEQAITGNQAPGTRLLLSAPRVNLPYLEVFFQTKVLGQ